MAPQINAEQQKQIQEKLKNMSPEEIQKLIASQCIFCKIANGELKANIIYEDKNIMAVLDTRPANPGHTLIFPKTHYSIMPQVPDADIARLFTLAKYVSIATFEATSAQGTNIIVSTGAIAGQGSQHVLIHIIPRFEKDGMPNQFWQPKELKPEQMDALAKQIISKLNVIKTQQMAPVKPTIKTPNKKTKTKLKKIAPRHP